MSAAIQKVSAITYLLKSAFAKKKKAETSTMGIMSVTLLPHAVTPREKLLRLPEIPTDIIKRVNVTSANENPFRMPTDSGVFAMREEDKRLKLEASLL